MTSSKPVSILFVCAGNTCRSPMAQAVFQHLMSERGLENRFGRIESAGTGVLYEGGKPNDSTIAVCRKENIPISSRSQAVKPEFYSDFDYILGMDRYNMEDLISKDMQPEASTATIKLFGEFGDGRSIEDPYGRPQHYYEKTYQQVLEYSKGLLDSIVGEGR